MYEIKEYKGYTIEIHLDDCAMNPFEQWDGLPSLLSVYDGHLDSYGEFDAEYLPNLTREEIKNNLFSFLLFLNDCSTLWDVKNKTHGYDGWPLDNSSLVGKINTLLQSKYKEASLNFGPARYCEKLEILSGILSIKNIPHILTSSTGYVQGAYNEILVIENDKVADMQSLQSAAEIYASWCWGDIYGYSIKNSENEEISRHDGFYGANHEKSGLIPAAKDEIDQLIAYTRRAKIQKVKTLIKNKVPLQNRERLLSNI